MNQDYEGKGLVDAGSSIAGSSAGAAVGALVGSLVAGPGPGTVGGAVAGAAAGSALSETIKRGLVEVARRVLSYRESVRVGATIDFAAIKIKKRLEAGDRPRDDGFFTADQTARSKADELFEGALLKAKNENQEKKLPYLGNFFANISFREDVSADLANYFLKVAEDLSYRQFCLLEYVARNTPLDAEPLRGRSHELPELKALVREEMVLHNPGDFGGYGLIAGTKPLEDALSSVGELFVELFALFEIPKDDIGQISKLFEICKQSPVTLPTMVHSDRIQNS